MQKIIVPKDYLVCVGGHVHNHQMDVEYVHNVTNERGDRLKYCYNTTVKTLSIVHYPADYESVEIEYMPKIIN